MTDSVAVFSPGFRLTDSSMGAPLSGAVIRFFDAGTTTPKTVYADQGLTTALGTSVTTDSLGYPTSDGSTKTLVYTDTSSYDIRIETSTGATIAFHPNVPGAVEAGSGGVSGVTNLETPVVTESLSKTLDSTYKNNIVRVNCTGGDVTLTMPSAASASIGQGWGFWSEHAGSANQAIFTAFGSETFTDGVTNYGGTFVFVGNGQGCRFTSDGGNWVVSQHTPPSLKCGSLILQIADRLASAPGSAPEAGTLYIATAAATWGSTSVANHDVVLHTSGGAYVKITPPTDCGWIAFVQDENLNYQFKDSAWVAETATTSAPGTVRLATDAETATATATDRVAALAQMRRHPGMAKAWGVVTYSSGTPTLQSGSHNITSITDTAVGRLTVTIADDFANANYVVLGNAEEASGNPRIITTSQSTRAAGSFEISCGNTGGSNTDPVAISFACFGTLA